MSTNGLIQSHNGHFDFNDDDIIHVPANVFNDIDSAITISFGVMVMKIKCHLIAIYLKAEIKMDIEVVNCHLPWSNSNVYGMLEITGQDRMIG